MRGSQHDQLWNQIEAEIHLHRHKTVIRACRGRKDPNKRPPAPPPSEPTSDEDAEIKARKRRGIGEPRTVVLHKERTEGLGISITVRIPSVIAELSPETEHRGGALIFMLIIYSCHQYSFLI